MAKSQKSIEERISEKEVQYEQIMEKAKQYQPCGILVTWNGSYYWK